MAQPSYGDDGELLDGGFDMSTGGVCGCVSLFAFFSSFFVACVWNAWYGFLSSFYPGGT